MIKLSVTEMYDIQSSSFQFSKPMQVEGVEGKSNICNVVYTGVKVFRFMTEFRFLEVLRGHFSKLCKSVEKTREGVGGTPFSFAVNLLLTT